MKKWNTEYLASAFQGKDVLAGLEWWDSIGSLEDIRSV
jgi:hypothetical protein